MRREEEEEEEEEACVFLQNHRVKSPSCDITQDHFIYTSPYHI
jgi:hypothetical protein